MPFHLSGNEHQYLHRFMTFITNKGSNSIIKHLQLSIELYNKMRNVRVSDSINQAFINILNSFVNKSVKISEMRLFPSFKYNSVFLIIRIG